MKQLGPYQIGDRIGAGGMGEVFRAYDERLARWVALKRILPEKASVPENRARFLREARIAAKLNHPALVQIHDILEDEHDPWIVMELVEGQTLSSSLKVGPLSVAAGLWIGRQVASGLAAMHEAGILHRDLKTENVMILGDPSSHYGQSGLRILDFGLAISESRSDDISASGQILGTPRALSPEQIQNSRSVDGRSDLFAFGVLLYEVWVGKSPFSAAEPEESLHRVCFHAHRPARESRKDLPIEISDLVDRLLAKKPDDRPATAGVVASELAAWEGSYGSGQPITQELENKRRGAASPETPDPGLWQRSGERRQIVVLSGELSPAKQGVELGPEQIYRISPNFRSFVQQSTARFGAHLADFQDLRFVIYSGYPQVYEDNLLRAVLLAKAICNWHWPTGGRPTGRETEPTHDLSVRIGMHSGSAVLLRTGDKESLILGTTFEVAGEMLKRADPGEILASKQTQLIFQRVLSDSPTSSIELESLGSPWLKPEGTICNPPPVPTSLPWVGRREELGLITDLHSAAMQGAGQAVLVVGDAGIGKSRLIKEVRLRANAHPLEAAFGSPWLISEGHHCGKAIPLFALRNTLFLETLLDLFRQSTKCSETPGLHKTLLECLITPLEAKAQLLHLLDPTMELDANKASETTDLISELLIQVLEAIQAGSHGAVSDGQSNGLVLVFENLQWLDTWTVELVQNLITLCSAFPLMMILTCRMEHDARRGPFKHLTRIRLGPLTSTQTSDLNRKVAAEVRLPPSALDEIEARSAGNPRYLQHLMLEQFQSQEPNSGIPDALCDYFYAKLDRLGSTRNLVHIAALMPQPIAIQDILRIWPMSRASLDAELHRLFRADILIQVDSEGREIRFQSELFREAAITSLLPEDLERLTDIIRRQGSGTQQDRKSRSRSST